VICEKCTGSKCCDRPTEAEPLLIPCDCGGETESCSECKGTGEVKITDCPSKIVGSDTNQVLLLSDMARRGCLPESGGVMDQCGVTMEAIALVQALEAPHRAKARLTDGI
jgi:hypothetical protein